MEKGFFWIWASRGYGAITGYGGVNYWSYEKPGYHDFIKAPKNPSEGSVKIMESSKENYVKQGFRCPNCKMVIFHYGEEKKEPNEE